MNTRNNNDIHGLLRQALREVSGLQSMSSRTIAPYANAMESLLLKAIDLSDKAEGEAKKHELTTLIDSSTVPALEVLVDIARTIGERRCVAVGDSRDNLRTMCQWADEFQTQFEANPDAGQTYIEDIEQFAIDKAIDAGWTVCAPENSERPRP